jgi:hypothetical protein
MLSAQAVTHKKFDGGKDRKGFFYEEKHWRGCIVIGANSVFFHTFCSN